MVLILILTNNRLYNLLVFYLNETLNITGFNSLQIHKFVENLLLNPIQYFINFLLYALKLNKNVILWISDSGHEQMYSSKLIKLYTC